MIARWLLGILCLSGLVATMQAGKINVHKNYIRPRGKLKPLIVPLLLHKQQNISWWSFFGISWKHRDAHNFSFACAQFFFNSMKEIIISQFYFCMFCLNLNIKQADIVSHQLVSVRPFCMSSSCPCVVLLFSVAW